MWIVCYKQSIYLGEDKTKFVLFTEKKTHKQLNICNKSAKIKQYKTIDYLGCILNNNLSGEHMVLEVLNKVDSKLKFLYRQSEHLNPRLRRMLCNAFFNHILITDAHHGIPWSKNVINKTPSCSE